MAKGNFKRGIFALTTAAAVASATGCGDSASVEKPGRGLSGTWRGQELARGPAENATVDDVAEARHFNIYNRYRALLDAQAEGESGGDGPQRDDVGGALLRCSARSSVGGYQ